MASGILIGSKVEEEHKGTYRFIQRTFRQTGHIPSFKQVTRSIARDHLKEDPNYYSKLKRSGL